MKLKIFKTLKNVFLLSLGVCLILSSCGSSENQKTQVNDPIAISLDTVMVDAGNDFLYLKYGMFMSQLSSDKSYLINLNHEDYIAEKIDLNKLELSNKIQFEKEGPNGLGPYLSGFSLRENGDLLIKNYMVYKVFDQEAQLVGDLELEKIAAEYLGSTEYYPIQVFELVNDPTRVVVLALKWDGYEYSLLDIDMETKTYTVKELDYFDKANEFRVNILYNGNPAGGFGPSVYSDLVNDRIILNTNAYNEVVIMDLKTDSVTVKSWETPLLGAKRTYQPPKEVEMEGGKMIDIRKKFEEDISYKGFLWDEEQQRFYRFSERKIFGEEVNEFGEYIPTGAVVYLSIFDQDFNLLQESELPEVKSVPDLHFMKDGAIWLFENIDDELAFVRLNLENS